MKTLDDSLIQTATQRLVAEFQPEQIWLFGSHAWGMPTEDSDVDLMVIVPHSEERSIQRMQRAHRCLRGIGFAKDVLVPTRALGPLTTDIAPGYDEYNRSDGRKM